MGKSHFGNFGGNNIAFIAIRPITAGLVAIGHHPFDDDFPDMTQKGRRTDLINRFKGQVLQPGNIGSHLSKNQWSVQFNGRHVRVKLGGLTQF